MNVLLEKINVTLKCFDHIVVSIVSGVKDPAYFFKKTFGVLKLTTEL